jgi:ribosomal protein S19
MKENINILNFLKKDFFLKNNYFLKLYNRNIKITENMVGLKLSVYNGKFFIPVKITENMVNHILGSFSFSRSIYLINKGIHRRRLKKK